MINSTGLPPNWRPILFGSTSEEVVGPCTIYRAAAPSLATREEIEACPPGITWIDLRSPHELLLDPVGVPDWPSVHMPLTVTDERLSRDRMVDVLGALLAGELTFGDLYVQMLMDSPDRFAAAISAVAAVDGPALVACQGGRDRTGTLVAVILDFIGVDRPLIVADYLRTNADQTETIRRQPTSEGERMLADYDMTCLASDIERALDYLVECGGARSYLSAHLAGDIDALADNLRSRIHPDTSDRSLFRKATS